MSDAAILWNPEKMEGDLALSGQDLLLDNPLRTAVMVSLFSDRVAPEQVTATEKAIGLQPPGTPASSGLSPRRGWWGDMYEEAPIGSRLWQMRRLIKANGTSVLNEVRAVIYEALQWMITDGIANQIDVSATWSSTVRNAVVFAITIHEPTNDAPTNFQFGWAWNGLGGSQ